MYLPAIRAPKTTQKALRFGAPLAAAAAIATLASACSSSHSKLLSTSATTSPVPAGPVVRVLATAKYGRILTTPTGFVLYTYTADKPGGPGCSGQCLVAWPPLLLPAGVSRPVSPAGVTGLGTFRRGQQLQVTLKGLPLYTFYKDKVPGQITGQKVADPGGIWYLAVVAAPAATRPSATSTSTTTPTTMPPVTAAPVTQPPVTAPPPTPAPTTTPTTTPPTTVLPPPVY